MSPDTETLLTTRQVAAALGISYRRVLALINSGRLPRRAWAVITSSSRATWHLSVRASRVIRVAGARNFLIGVGASARGARITRELPFSIPYHTKGRAVGELMTVGQGAGWRRSRAGRRTRTRRLSTWPASAVTRAGGPCARR